MEGARMKLAATVLDAPDAREPAGPGDPQMSMHLDIEVDDLDVTGAQAVAAGATLAEFQPQDDVRVFLDPAGHPFCLFLPE
jgi:Glyoxalase-like domain